MRFAVKDIKWGALEAKREGQGDNPGICPGVQDAGGDCEGDGLSVHRKGNLRALRWQGLVNNRPA